MTKSVTMKDLEEESVKEYRTEWTQTNKRRTTREYFPDVSEGLIINLQVTQIFRDELSGHRKLSLQNNRRTNVFMWRTRTDNTSHNICTQNADKERDRVKRTVTRQGDCQLKKGLERRHWNEFIKLIYEI